MGKRLREKYGKNRKSRIRYGRFLSLLRDEPILAVFHSSSSGATEASENVWREKLPYLISVKTPEKSEDVPNFSVSKNLTLKEFRETILSAFPDAAFPADPSSWIEEIKHTESGPPCGDQNSGRHHDGGRIQESVFSALNSCHPCHKRRRRLHHDSGIRARRGHEPVRGK